MKRLLFALVALAFLWPSGASAQCIGVGGVNNVPQPGIVCPEESIVPTYFGNSLGIVPATAPTDIACLTGSATKTIRVKQVVVSGTAGTAINITVNLNYHTVANTGGTAASTVATGKPILTPMDSAFAAATATGAGYTANPTIDTTFVTVSTKTMFLPVTSTAAAGGTVQWDFFPQVNASPLVLRGVAQQVCANLNGVTTPSSGVMAVSWIWTEQ